MTATAASPATAAPARSRRHGVSWGPFSLRWRPRALLVLLLAALSAAALVVVSLGTGDYTLSPGEVVAALAGEGSRRDLVVVQAVRLPRILTGVAAGMALGLAGAIAQTAARNALASPDLLGITAGASAGAVAVITLGGRASATGWLREVGVPTAAIAGAVLAAVVVLVLVGRTGLVGISPLLVGLGVSAFFVGVVSLLLIAAPIQDAARANVWLTGSLNQRSWPELWPLALALLIGVVVLVPLAPRLDSLHLGADVARATGLAVAPTVLVLAGAAVVLTGVSAAAVGPLGFVALVAPHLARIASGTARAPLAAAAAFGAAIVVGGDLLARTLVAPIQLPAGAVIAVLGGPLLIVLLITNARRAS